MPVFLTPVAWDTWLDPEKIDRYRAGDLLDLLDLLDVESRTVAATLRTRPASRAVNTVRTLDRTDPNLIEPSLLETARAPRPEEGAHGRRSGREKLEVAGAAQAHSATRSPHAGAGYRTAAHLSLHRRCRAPRDPSDWADLGDSYRLPE
ncbi:SOS response-associated peptidase family protein [Dietzia maris]|uniref:hypothetical protein n=1 Tax=Dietzia maris TaxID=37915 RepID=UPI0036DDF1DF